MKLCIIILFFFNFILSQNTNTEKINNLLNNWHQAASIADENVFFDVTMSDDAIYIGTDASELWTKEEMQAWAKEVFERDTAWDFKVLERNIYYYKNNKVAWFDELLDTWMGVCRASGVVEKQKGKWKLKHYHLSIAVPNEVVQEYLQLIGKEK